MAETRTSPVDGGGAPPEGGRQAPEGEQELPGCDGQEARTTALGTAGRCHRLVLQVPPACGLPQCASHRIGAVCRARAVSDKRRSGQRHSRRRQPATLDKRPRYPRTETLTVTSSQLPCSTGAAAVVAVAVRRHINGSSVSSQSSQQATSSARCDQHWVFPCTVLWLCDSSSWWSMMRCYPPPDAAGTWNDSKASRTATPLCACFQPFSDTPVFCPPRCLQHPWRIPRSPSQEAQAQRLQTLGPLQPSTRP
jgi:hypothetical protein